MGKYIFFKDEEVLGLKPDLVYKLDRARDLFGSPMVITSGYRDPIYNKEIGGIDNSAHTKGMAVDIRCVDHDTQKRMIWALCCSGFKRVEAGSRHIHVDIDDTKPSPAFWIDESK